MSHALKSKINISAEEASLAWQPSAPQVNLVLRAEILKNIRDFFYERGVLEVETPLIQYTSVTDPHIESIPALIKNKETFKNYYLQTSPEYAMKRMLAAGYPSIYQICKAFRQEECGRQHNPEFTLLEWYRLGFTHHDLMQEMDALLQKTLKTPPAEYKTYTEIFYTFFAIDPHHTSVAELKACAQATNISVNEEINDIDTWLQLLMSHCIEPTLGIDRPYFVYDFPVSQAALSRIIPGTPPVAARFEVYIKGTELANGFYELADAKEQRHRFEKNLIERKKNQHAVLPIDEYLLQALEHGLPDCAGVALGIDRLVMLAANTKNIADTLSFDFDRVSSG